MFTGLFVPLQLAASRILYPNPNTLEKLGFIIIRCRIVSKSLFINLQISKFAIVANVLKIAYNSLPDKTIVKIFPIIPQYLTMFTDQ